MNSVYNYKGIKFNLCMESNPIETYEPCQVRKEAAISSNLYVETFHREIKYNHFLSIKDVKKWGTQLFIENLDH